MTWLFRYEDTALFLRTVHEEVIAIGAPFTTLFYGYVRHNTSSGISVKQKREEAIV